MIPAYVPLRWWLGLLLLAIPMSAASEISDPSAHDGTPQTAATFTGLAQAPEANLFTGSASTSIPIEIPPGLKNVTPRIALAYASGAGPSPYGYGWSLPLGTVQRTGKYGVLYCDDPTYEAEFVLSLPGARIECTLEPAPANGRRRCVPRIEQSYVQIYHTPFNTWQVWDKSGTLYEFGAGHRRTGSDVGSIWNSNTPCGYTHTWALGTIRDSNGNSAVIEYNFWDGILHPHRISYGGNDNGESNSPWPKFELLFTWRDRLPEDQLFSAIGGFPAKLR